MFLLVMASI